MVYVKPLRPPAFVPAAPAPEGVAARWEPPSGVETFANLSIDEARRQIGGDAVVREDPYFGRRGIVKKVIPDAEHGFLVAVHVYSPKKNARGEWEEMFRSPPEARKFLEPGRVEIV